MCYFLVQFGKLFWRTRRDLDRGPEDKKNENKEVAVDQFMGAEHAVEAISHSM